MDDITLYMEGWNDCFSVDAKWRFLSLEQATFVDNKEHRSSIKLKPLECSHEKCNNSRQQ